MSAILLKEKANKTEWFCVFLAFTGALFVIKPSFQMQSVYALIGMLGGLGAGCVQLHWLCNHYWKCVV